VSRRRLPREEIIDLRMQVIQGEDDEVLEIIRALSVQRKVACFSNTHAIHWDHMLANYRSSETNAVAMDRPQVRRCTSNGRQFAEGKRACEGARSHSRTPQY
jgi:hypothetical protein